MPLIMMSGYPCSGKTTRAQQIHDFFAAKIAELGPTEPRVARLKLHLINDEGLGISREVYREAKSEKDARATFYGAVKRFMSKDDIVIADGMNYIKGYRYQLFCEAKALLTPSCVVYAGTPADRCREWNADSNISSEEGSEEKRKELYPVDILDNLIFRYEEPNGMTRWDSPLFTIPYIDETVPGETIWEAMINNTSVRPNQATVLQPASESNYLQVLDKATQEIVALIMEYQKMNGDSGGEVKVKDAIEMLVLPPSQVTLGQLQRLRRQFITMNRTTPLVMGRVRDLFIEHINNELT